MTTRGEVSGLLLELGRGDPGAMERLLPLVYDELHVLARRHRFRWPRHEAPGTTSLVHEAYLKLVDQSRVDWQNGRQFFYLASRAMRSILVDNARRHHRQKRGGEHTTARTAVRRAVLPSNSVRRDEKPLPVVMSPPRLERLEALFGAALERPADERRAFLAEACGDDPALLAEVTALLAADAPADLYFERLASEVAASCENELEAAAGRGRRIGPYLTVELLGQGGMGAVYLARRVDGQFEQWVALKLVRRGMEGAEAPLRDAYELRRRLHGGDHPSVAASLNNLASLYAGSGRLAEAEARAAEALAIRRARFGDDHRLVGESLANLGLLARDRGDLGVARAHLERALEVLRGALGDAHPGVATALNNLATVAHREGDLAGAEALYRRALALRRAALPPGHPHLAYALVGLGKRPATPCGRSR